MVESGPWKTDVSCDLLGPSTWSVPPAVPQAKGDELDHFRASNMRALRRIAARPETDGPQGGWGLDLGGQGLSEGMTDVTVRGMRRVVRWLGSRRVV